MINAFLSMLLATHPHSKNGSKKTRVFKSHVVFLKNVSVIKGDQQEIYVHHALSKGKRKIWRSLMVSVKTQFETKNIVFPKLPKIKEEIINNSNDSNYA